MQVFKTKDGFLWADVTSFSDMLWQSQDFELYALYKGSAELIQNEWQYTSAKNDELIIAIELCNIEEIKNF